jgi:outer membrane lipoprotein-sorting protein
MKRILRILFLLVFIQCFIAAGFSQEMTALVQKVKAKLDLVNDYVAEGKMKTDVAFIKAPVGKVKIFYKKPNQFKLKRDHGISILPKGGVSINMSSVIATTNYVALYAGDAEIDGTKTKIVKLLPMNENSDIVLTTMYIDEANLLIKKAVTTTKENGTFEMQFTYGNYGKYGLPDKVIFGFNTKNYKMPKGITLEFEDGDKPTAADKLRGKKGRIEITYTSYIINKGVSDEVFK